MSERKEKILDWLRPAVRDLKPYYKAPLEGNPLRLDQNTNLYGRNPAIDKVGVTDADQYPTRDADALMAALAETHGLSPEHFVAGNGSDEAIELLCKAFTPPGAVLATPTPGFSIFPFLSRLFDLKHRAVRLGAGFKLDVDGLLEQEARLTIIASPNNPTGNAFPRADLERVIEETDGIVLVDEAYAEFLGEDRSFLRRVDEYDNLVVSRTFSKAHGLAGLRIGYLAGNPDLIERIRLVKAPFNLNVHSEAVAVAALADTSWMEGVVADTITERDRMARGLKKRGFKVHPSDANFLLTDAPDDPGRIIDGLRRQGILIRGFPGVEGLERSVRFTVGRPEHTDLLMDALDGVLA